MPKTPHLVAGEVAGPPRLALRGLRLQETRVELAVTGPQQGEVRPAMQDQVGELAGAAPAGSRELLTWSRCPGMVRKLRAMPCRI